MSGLSCAFLFRPQRRRVSENTCPAQVLMNGVGVGVACSRGSAGCFVAAGECGAQGLTGSQGQISSVREATWVCLICLEKEHDQKFGAAVQHWESMFFGKWSHGKFGQFGVQHSSLPGVQLGDLPQLQPPQRDTGPGETCRLSPRWAGRRRPGLGHLCPWGPSAGPPQAWGVLPRERGLFAVELQVQALGAEIPNGLAVRWSRRSPCELVRGKPRTARRLEFYDEL